MSSATETAVPTIAGGFTIPQSPRRRLQSIQNNQVTQPVAPTTPPPTDEQMSIGADEHLSKSASEQVSSSALTQPSTGADEQVREQALTQGSNQASEDASAEAITQGSEQVSKRVSKPVSAEAIKGASTRVSTQVDKRGSNQGSGRASQQASAPASVYDEADSVEERVREMLALKRTHPGGTKGSVDMDPDLMKRVKRYLLDNGDPSFRILVIELVEAFLEKEGY